MVKPMIWLWNALKNLHINQPRGASPIKGKTMFEIEKYKKPTDWALVALWVVVAAALVVLVLDLFVWRP
jgi:hypothetical protein